MRILPLSSDDVVPEGAGEAIVNLAVTNELSEFTCSYEFPFTVAALTAPGTASKDSMCTSVVFYFIVFLSLQQSTRTINISV